MIIQSENYFGEVCSMQIKAKVIFIKQQEYIFMLLVNQNTLRDRSLFTGGGGGGPLYLGGGSLFFELHFGEGHF